MCRLYGQISVAPASARDFLADSGRSLLVQSYIRPHNLQKDGWGIGYYVGRKAIVIKSPLPIFEEKARFKTLSARVRSRIVIGHIRAASNPRGLPKKSIMGPANAQPFTDGRIVFAHNGTLQIPDEVATFLGPLRRRIRGANDSEVYFWQLIKHLETYGNIPDALQACVRETWTLWKRCRKRYPRKKYPYTGLNTLVSDGRSLHALCLYPNKNGGMHCLFDSKRPWGQMNLARRDRRVIIASEAMDESRWNHLNDAEIVSAGLRDGKLEIRHRRFRPGE